MSAPRVSIVISTLNRASPLSLALTSLDWLSYPGEFEVIVVNGPSTDGTVAVLERWSDRIKIAQTPHANLSVSRNVGAALAAGEIIAFLDDDAVPEAEWLIELAPAYERADVAAAGGFVFDHTGLEYAFRFETIDRLGVPQPWGRSPAGLLAFPGSWLMPSLLGANSSFRADSLREIDGFDEQYDYFLDESDVLVRLIDGGAAIAQLGGAHVHHKYAPSSIRAGNRFARDRYAVLKNHAYFGLRHARSFLSAAELRRERAWYEARNREEIATGVMQGQAPREALESYDEYSSRALAQGVADAAEPRKRGDFRSEPPAFRAFRPRASDQVRRALVVAASRTDALRLGDRARSLASDGTVVHLIRPTDGIDNVDFDDGVWLHNVRRRDRSWDEEAAAEVDRVRRRFPGAAVV